MKRLAAQAASRFCFWIRLDKAGLANHFCHVESDRQICQLRALSLGIE